jgi:histidinol phosphatase-like PHP family hydrolase
MIDFHAHTNMSYCAEPNLTPEVYSNLIKTNSEVDAVYVTDHGMAVYFPPEIAWKWEYISNSHIFDSHRDWGNNRLAKHLAELANLRESKVLPGLEVEMMHDGRLTVDDSFRKEIDILIGSVHYLNSDIGENRKTVLDRWKKHTNQLINSGIDVLGHPFRWISNQLPVSKDIVRQIVREAKNAGIAMELNGHFVVPTDVDMLKACVEFGVPVSIGTDSHALTEIGDFSYHLATIESAGLSLAKIKLFTPRNIEYK